MGRGGYGLERGGGAQAPEAGIGGGRRGLGQGVGQGGQESGLAEARAAARFESITEEVGGREDLLVAGTKPQDEQKDYERLPESSEAFVYVAMTRLMARRLARA